MATNFAGAVAVSGAAVAVLVLLVLLCVRRKRKCVRASGATLLITHPGALISSPSSGRRCPSSMATRCACCCKPNRHNCGAGHANAVEAVDGGAVAGAAAPDRVGERSPGGCAGSAGTLASALLMLLQHAGAAPPVRLDSHPAVRQRRIIVSHSSHVSSSSAPA